MKRTALVIICLQCMSYSLYAQNTAETNNQTLSPTTKNETTAQQHVQQPVNTNTGSNQKQSADPKPGDTQNIPPAQPDAQTQKRLEAEKKRVNWIKKTIQFGIHSERASAIRSILSLKEQASKDEVIILLNEIMPHEANPEVKHTAITIASELKYSSSIPWIIEALNDNSESVRIEAVYALHRLNAVETITTMSGILKNQNFTENSNYTEALIHTLGRLKAVALKDFAIERIKDNTTTDNLRQLLILFLGNIEDINSRDFLLELAKNNEEDSTSRSYAVLALAQIGATDTADEIMEIIKQIDSYPLNKRRDYYSFSMYCTAALVRMGNSSAVPRLMESLRSNNAVVRLRAVQLIKELKDKRTVDILKYKMNHDPSPRVQSAARDALKEMGEEVDESK